jgi:hypothetical protein
MHSFFSSTKKKQKGESYYHRENLIQTEYELCKVLDHLESTTATKTSLKILFQSRELDSIIKKNMAKDFGKESFLLKPNSNISGHEIYFYHITSDGLRFLVQLHFVDDLFFFAANKVYSDMFLSDSDREKIVNRVKNKYCKDADNEIIEFEVIDAVGNILYSRDDVYYFIKYLANNPTSQKLKKQYKCYVRPGQGQKTNDKLDGLI